MKTITALQRLAKLNLYPGDWQPGYFGGHKYVAAIGQIGDWAVYTGPDSWTFEDIRHVGDKIQADDAKKIFPDLAVLRLTYRR